MGKGVHPMARAATALGKGGKAPATPMPASPLISPDEELVPDYPMPVWNNQPETFDQWLTELQTWRHVQEQAAVEHDWMEIGEKRKGGPNDEEDPDLRE